MPRLAAQNSVALCVRFDAQYVMSSVIARTIAKTTSASVVDAVGDGEDGHRPHPGRDVLLFLAEALPGLRPCPNSARIRSSSGPHTRSDRRT